MQFNFCYKTIYKISDLSEGGVAMRMNFVCEKQTRICLDLKLNVPLLLGKGEEEMVEEINNQSWKCFEAF